MVAKAMLLLQTSHGSTETQNSKLRTLFDVTMFTQHIRRITDLRGIREAEEEEVNIIANWPRRL